MSRGPLFLSAGVPSKNVQRYARDPVAVREAVRAFVAVNVPDHELVFGGHPAISPFVWDAAHSLGAEDRVVIYQSEWFRNRIPKEASYFKRLVWTPLDSQQPGDLNACLLVMRQWMLHLRRLPDGSQLPPFDAAVLIGGEDGVEQECDLFTAAYPKAPIFPVATTQGAAFHILDDPTRSRHVPAAIRHDLATEIRYRELFRRIARLIP